MERLRQFQISRVAALLEAAGVESALWDARQLVTHVLNSDVTATDADLVRLDELVEQRARRIPLQLLLGDTGFRLITVACAPGVFIPRPETERLVELVLAEAAGRKTPRIIEPCTGSGAIAASLVSELDSAFVYATDINETAVALARQNILRVMTGDAGVASRPNTIGAEVLHGSLCDPLDRALCGHIDVIVCNPPYLPWAVHQQLPTEVRDYDPHDALIGGIDGHEVVGAVFNTAAQWLMPGGLVALEVDATRHVDAGERAHAAGLIDVKTHADLTGELRFITARRGP